MLMNRVETALVNSPPRRWLQHYYGQRVRLARGSATDLHTTLGEPVSRYDAVFDFAIIHHIPHWPDAIAEIARVLPPGGKFHFDEVTALALATSTYRP